MYWVFIPYTCLCTCPYLLFSEARRGNWIPWECNSRELWDTWVLRTESRSSGEQSVLLSTETFLQPNFFLSSFCWDRLLSRCVAVIIYFFLQKKFYTGLCSRTPDLGELNGMLALHEMTHTKSHRSSRADSSPCLRWHLYWLSGKRLWHSGWSSIQLTTSPQLIFSEIWSCFLSHLLTLIYSILIKCLPPGSIWKLII